MKSISQSCMPVVAAAFACFAVTALAQSSPAVEEDAGQLTSDKAALQRQLKRVETDEARLEYDRNSGRMSAESKDAYEVYRDRQATKGEKKDIAADKTASLQMKADKAALHRQIRRLEVAEARLKSDAASGKTAAESKDAERTYKDGQAIKGEKSAIVADKTKLKADQKQ